LDAEVSRVNREALNCGWNAHLSQYASEKTTKISQHVIIAINAQWRKHLPVQDDSHENNQQVTVPL